MLRALLPTVAVMLIVTGCVASTPARTPAAAASARPTSTSATAAPGVVPWVDRSAAQYVARTPHPYPTDARLCTAADLAATSQALGAAMGNSLLRIEFTNRSGSPCLLAGTPTLSGISAIGSVTRLAAQSGTYFGDPGPPANLPPHEIAALNIAGAIGCPTMIAGKHAVYPMLRIGLASGSAIDVAAQGFDTICGVSVSAFGVPADVVPEPNPSPTPLTATITAPATATPGQLLAFTVTLTNGSSEPYQLSPCPSYVEFVGSGSNTWVATIRYYFLNCDALSVIPAGGSATFAMQLQLPADQPAGQAKFGWAIQGDAGPWANAQLKIVATGG